jgi:hypothetical protein
MFDDDHMASFRDPDQLGARNAPAKGVPVGRWDTLSLSLQITTVLALTPSRTKLNSQP